MMDKFYPNFQNLRGLKMDFKNRIGTPKQHEPIKFDSPITRFSKKYTKIFKPKKRIIYATDDNFLKIQLFHDKLTSENRMKIND